MLVPRLPEESQPLAVRAEDDRVPALRQQAMPESQRPRERLYGQQRHWPGRERIPMSRWGRQALRTTIDLAAIYAAFAIQFAASGSFAAAFITGGAVGLYGAWCYYDGSA